MSLPINPKQQPVLAYLGAVSSGVLLALSSLFPQLFLLAWVAFVPLLLVLRNVQSLGQAYRLGLCAGLVLYLLSTYWMVVFIQLLDEDYTPPLSIGLASLYWLYCAQMLALIAVLTHYLRRENSVLWVFAIVVSGVFALYPTLFSVQVGETQSEFLIALQAIEFTGVFGLDFIIALVNGLIAQAILGQNCLAKRSVGFAYALVVLWFGFGAWSLPHWNSIQNKATSLRIGLAQPNQIPSTEPVTPHPGYSRTYPLEMAMAEQLLQHRVDLLVWPEMRNRDYYDQAFVQAAYRKKVAAWQTPLVFQDRELQQDGENRQLFNTATLIDESGQQRGQYRKIKLIPVAEYMPWVHSNIEAKRWLRREFGSFFTDFTPGSRPQAFTTGDAVLIPLICYEVMFPSFVATAVASDSADQSRNKGRLLLAQSNNGWFGDTRQPYQHLGASVLRSVENRLPMVHAVNNGPGAVVMPSGEKHFQTAYRKTAAYVVDVPLAANSSPTNKGGNTFYNRYPNWVLMIIGGVFSVMLLRNGFRKSHRVS